MGNVVSLGNAIFVDSERSDDIVGVDGPQKGEMLDNLDVLGYRRPDEILRLEADYVCGDWSPNSNTSSEYDTAFERIKMIYVVIHL